MEDDSLDSHPYVCETLKMSKELLGRRSVKPSSVCFDPDWKPVPVAWWRRFFLLFKRTHISVDLGHGQDYGVKCYFKRLGGKIHVIRWETIARSQKEWNWKVVRVDNITVAQGWQCPECGLICVRQECPTCVTEKLGVK
jgi:hypothetical protein